MGNRSNRLLPFRERLARGYAVDGNGCWVWSPTRRLLTYGKVMDDDGREHLAHRAMYELVRGAIPDGMQIDHLCRNRACVNPAHLEPVTPQENTRRGFGPTAMLARQERCQRGHAFARRRDGTRVCLECYNAARREKYRLRQSPSARTTADPSVGFWPLEVAS